MFGYLALLDPVRVQLPDYDAAEPLQSVASVTVKQGALWVEVYDPDVSRLSPLLLLSINLSRPHSCFKTLKHVESAIHAANLPGISPQKDSSRTLRIPISRPSSETRTAIEKMIADQGEAAKIRLRGARTDALKALVDKDGRKGKWGTEVSRSICDGSRFQSVDLFSPIRSCERLNKLQTSSAQRLIH